MMATLGSQNMKECKNWLHVVVGNKSCVWKTTVQNADNIKYMENIIYLLYYKNLNTKNSR
jgi:vacuolar-type H+-ATPase subunit C/Vma6